MHCLQEKGKQNTARAYEARALFSHVDEQALGVAQLYGPRRHADREDTVEHIVSISTFGDASMWVGNPQERKDEDTVENSLTRRVSRCGRNVFLPVFSTTENLFSRRRVVPSMGSLDSNVVPYSSFSGIETHSPSIVLPRANATTVHS